MDDRRSDPLATVIWFAAGFTDHSSGVLVVAKVQHDGEVRYVRRALGWGGLLAGGVVLVGLGMFYATTRLDFADKWGSVVGALVALFSLPMTAYGIVLARREPKGRAGQAVTDTVAGGRLVQVRDVRGNLRVGARRASPRSPARQRRRRRSTCPTRTRRRGRWCVAPASVGRCIRSTGSATTPTSTGESALAAVDGSH
jgi:hypothetical protein